MSNTPRPLEFPAPLTGDGGPAHHCGATADWVGWVVWSELR